MLRNTSIRASIFIPTIVIILLVVIVSSVITFTNYQATTSNLVEDTSKEINKQIILNFENYIDSVIDTADYIQQKTIEYGLRDENEKLDEIYKQASDVNLILKVLY